MIDTEPLSTVVTLSTLPNGTAVYYNPVTNEKCSDYTLSNSEIGVTTGCLKWYVYNDSKDRNRVNLLLDHNIEENVGKGNNHFLFESIENAISEKKVHGKIKKSYVCGISEYGTMAETPFCRESTNDFDWDPNQTYEGENRGEYLNYFLSHINRALVKKVILLQ